MSKPQLIQLRTGQFIIGACETGDDGTVKISDPFEITIEPQQTPQGIVPRAGMFPYAMMSKTRAFSFSKDQIQLSPCEPDDNCATNWTEATSNVKVASPEESSLLLKG
jgi:hypothetical protein